MFFLVQSGNQVGPLCNHMSVNTTATLRMKVVEMLVLHPKLLTNHERVRRNLVVTDGCLMCGGGQETILHVLHDCSFATNIWRTGFKWSSPSHGWVKINTNGSKSMTNNWSIFGGVIQDSLGNWKEGFRKQLGRCSIFNAKLWVILFIVESDCMEAMECLTDRSGDCHSMTLIRKITTVKKCFQMVKFQFIRREGNMVANSIAKTCSKGDSELAIIDFPTFHGRKLLLADNLGDFFCKVFLS
uniref:RNase H type-1 domain-containing protein n=2 Tax=Gossypium raimondii TaxID=29730 RepID=A0A0D2VB42_GOSRA|nr:hypothetical protein B456_013G086700 [Gossypium raimondii]